MDKEVVVYIIGILFSHKKNEILPFATMWMELESIMLSEINQRRQIPYDFTPVWNLRNKTDEHRGRKTERQTIKETLK